MLEFELGIITAAAVCDGALLLGMYFDYRKAEREGKVKSASEYFWKGSDFSGKR